MQPLNSALYGQLCREFGNVLVSRAGEAATGRYVVERGRRTFSFDSPGEYYRVSCPFCSDTVNRLWINHRWGVGPAATVAGPVDALWWAATCYNEGCLQERAALQQLRSRVYRGIGRERRLQQGRQVFRGNTPPATLGHVEMPGTCVRIDQLPTHHQAVTYLANRGFDAYELGPRYGISFCQDAPENLFRADKRLIAPIVMRNELVGWQGRYIGEITNSKIPKYYTCPGTNKRLMLYGLDEALALPYAFVVEGVTDVWAIGAGAVALLGKTASQQQQLLLQHHWSTVVLLLDEGAYYESEAIYRSLRGVMSVVWVQLPADADPASLPREYLWDLIYGAASQQGVDLLATA